MAINGLGASLVTIMCWFHVKLNISKHSNLLPAGKYTSVEAAINRLHSKSASEYASEYESLKKQWFAEEGMKPFIDYLDSQWISSVFNKWQIFHTPPRFRKETGRLETGFYLMLFARIL